MKSDEIFTPQIKSKPIPKNIEFVLADSIHYNGIVALMSERNPNDSLDNIKVTTIKELKLNKDDSSYWLYVAVINSEVVGLCRFYHTNGLLVEKRKLHAPNDRFGMGLLVSSKWHRHNIAKFLTLERIKLLKKLGVTCLYSIVDSNNQSSVRMHENFGFIKIASAHGFLHLDFKDQIAYLYVLEF